MRRRNPLLGALASLGALAFLGAACHGGALSGPPGGDAGPGPGPGPDAAADRRGDASLPPPPPPPGDDAGSDEGSPPPSDPARTVGTGGEAFAPTPANSDGVEVGPEGELRLPTAGGPRILPHIWIANSSEGTVSKLDTRTGAELARYRTGPGSPDPSRTTVSLGGHVVVANRGGASATKIAGTLAGCQDRNGNGEIETSTGPRDVKAWGRDECVLWHRPFEAGALARAAAFDAQIAGDGYDSATVWIGLYNREEMVQLSSATGEILARVNVSPVHPYGAAMDRAGHVWAWGTGSVVRLHAVSHEKVFSRPPCGYGIGVDEAGRVFVAGSGCVARLDPGAREWRRGNVAGSNRGLAVDGAGSVWVASTSTGLHRVNADTLEIQHTLALPAPSRNFIGTAVDVDGQIWVVNRGGNQAFRVDPTTYAFAAFPVGDGPYTYSDMTGYQLRNAAAPPGSYRHVFAGCASATQWVEMQFDADAPADTAITFRLRGAATPEALSGPWVEVAQVPPATSPVALEPILRPVGFYEARYLELQIGLRSSSPDATPVVRSVSLRPRCPVE